MIEIKVPIAPSIFYPTYESKARRIIHQGGQSSGKTVNILIVLAIHASNNKNEVITVTAQSLPNLKGGALRDFERFVYPYFTHNIKQYNKSDHVFYFNSGSIIEFKSFENEQTARGAKRTRLFINEANSFDYLIYFQLDSRTDIQTIIDYNPSSKFFVHEKLIGDPENEVFISDHRSNPFLSDEKHKEIESIVDKELWNVYARGLTGKIKGLIYPNFRIIDEFPHLLQSVLGLDFGFNHKTALVEVGKDADRLFWHELIYQSELTIGDLIQLMKELNLGRKKIYADHAAADKIEDLKRAGFNVHKADKDVLNGIDFVKRNHLYITKGSLGLRKEIMSYKWKEKDGAPLDEPVKFNDDGMDAGRYGSYSHFRKGGGVVVGDARNTDVTQIWQPGSQSDDINPLDLI